MEIMTFTTGPIATNTYCFPVAENAYCLVDPGGEGNDLIRSIRSMGGNVSHVILTHGHYDHICFAKQLADKFGAKIVTGKHNNEFLSNTDYNGTARHGIPFTPFSADILLEDGEVFRLGETEIKYLYTPGHTSGCGVYIFDDVIISGDTLFCESYGRTDLPTGDDGNMIASLKKLKELEGDYHVIPGHGPMTTLEHERRWNPLMRRL